METKSVVFIYMHMHTLYIFFFYSVIYTIVT